MKCLLIGPNAIHSARDGEGREGPGNVFACSKQRAKMQASYLIGENSGKEKGRGRLRMLSNPSGQVENYIAI